MGKAKLKMELISNERSRTLTFKKRKEGLTRKLHEFTTLCDVNACMIIYGPKPEHGPDMWPQNNPDKVRRMIELYRARNTDSGSKSFGLSDFFSEKKRKLEEELVKLRRKNLEAKCPTWLEFLNDLSEAQLRDFAVGLKNKAESVKSRIEFLKSSRNNNSGLDFDQTMMDAARLNQVYNLNQQQQQISSVDHHHHHVHRVNQELAMMMLMMNENDNQLIWSAGSFDHHDNVFYGMDPASPVSSMIYHGPTPIEQFYNLNQQQQQISSVDHHHHHHVHCANQDPLMMMLMMNEKDDQLIGTAGSFDDQDHNVFYGVEPASPVSPIIYHRPTPVEQYYAPPPLPLPLPLSYMPVMSELTQFSTMENYYHDGAALEDIFQDMIR